MDRGKEVFLLRVLFKNIVDIIRVYENDEPCDIAKAFVAKHKLGKNLENLLENEIEKNIEKVLQNNNDKVDEKLGQSQDFLKFETVLEHLTTNYTDSPRISQYNTSVNTAYNNIETYKSRFALDKIKLYRFKTIFQFLCPDNNGKISFFRIKRLNLQQKIYKILMPIINELKINKCFINYREFCTKMESLLKSLSSEEKYYILSPNLNLPNYSLPNRHGLGKKNEENWIRNCVSPF